MVFGLCDWDCSPWTWGVKAGTRVRDTNRLCWAALVTAKQASKQASKGTLASKTTTSTSKQVSRQVSGRHRASQPEKVPLTRPQSAQMLGSTALCARAVTKDWQSRTQARQNEWWFKQSRMAWTEGGYPLLGHTPPKGPGRLPGQADKATGKTQHTPVNST